MKATGIVRRIDETAIIGPSQKNLGKSMGSGPIFSNLKPAILCFPKTTVSAYLLRLGLTGLLQSSEVRYPCQQS